MFKAPFSFDGRIRRIEYFLSGIIGGIDQDGKRAEPFTESDEDLGCLRKTDVLSDE